MKKNMKRIIDNAFDAMCQAIALYSNVITKAIRECGEVQVIDENEEFEDFETPCYNIDYYDGERVWHYSIDKLRVGGIDENTIEFHAIKINYNDADEWTPIDYLADQGDLLLEAIQWPEDDQENERDNAKESVYLLYEGDSHLSSCSMTLRGVFTNGPSLSDGAMQLVRENAKVNYEQEIANGGDFESIEDFISYCHCELIGSRQYLGERSFMISEVTADTIE